MDLENIPTDDPCIFNLLTNGEVVGIFQVESEGMKKTVAQMRPTRLDDITAAISLYRPGPMQFIDSYCRRKHGEEEIEYIYPALEPILKRPMVYRIPGADPSALCTTWRLLGRRSRRDPPRHLQKNEKQIAKHRVKFRDGCVANGIPADKADEIYAAIEFFANYGLTRRTRPTML